MDLNSDLQLKLMGSNGLQVSCINVSTIRSIVVGWVSLNPEGPSLAASSHNHFFFPLHSLASDSLVEYNLLDSRTAVCGSPTREDLPWCDWVPTVIEYS